jgi:hypothetical protein
MALSVRFRLGMCKSLLVLLEPRAAVFQQCGAAIKKGTSLVKSQHLALLLLPLSGYYDSRIDQDDGMPLITTRASICLLEEDVRSFHNQLLVLIYSEESICHCRICSGERYYWSVV